MLSQTFKYGYLKIKRFTSFSFIEKLYRISSRKIQEEKNFHLRTNLLPISWEEEEEEGGYQKEEGKKMGESQAENNVSGQSFRPPAPHSHA